MTKRALIVEAASEEHKRSHFPHNPYCDICVRAHMRQHTMSRKEERKDEELPAVTTLFERISADHMYHERPREDGMVHYISFTIRDEYNGCGIAHPRKTRSQKCNYRDLKRFVGHVGASRPNIPCKSDAASEITNAVEELGWLSEPSLQNRFPHNTRDGLAR